MKKECATCKFMREHPLDSQTGGGDTIMIPHCHRHAPQPKTVPLSNLFAKLPSDVVLWSPVSYRDECGEYKAVKREKGKQ